MTAARWEVISLKRLNEHGLLSHPSASMPPKSRLQISSKNRLPYCSAVHAMLQCNLTERLTEYSSVFLQNSHREDCLRKSLMLVLAALLRGHFLESRGNSYLNFLQPHTQLYGVKFKNGRFQQSLPPRISELRIHSPSLVRMDGRRPWRTRLSGRNRKTVTHESTQCDLFVKCREEDGRIVEDNLLLPSEY